MKLEKIRHHVLEGMRLFVKEPPDSEFQEGFLASLEAVLRKIDDADAPGDVFYAGNNNCHGGLTPEELEKLRFEIFDKGKSVDWSKTRHEHRKAEQTATLAKVRGYLLRELNVKGDPSDSDYIFGWRAALEEVRRLMNYVPSYRLQFKVPREPSVEPRIEAAACPEGV